MKHACDVIRFPIILVVLHARCAEHRFLPLITVLPRVLVCSLLIVSVSGCDTGSNPKAGPEATEWFADVTSDRRLSFVHGVGPEEEYQFPDIMGSGGAVLDYDRDGLLDLLLVQNQGPDSMSTTKVFRQQPDHTFTDATAGSGLAVAGDGMGATCADINNDGWTDVLISFWPGNRLFLNQRGKFVEIPASQSGIANPHWSAGAAFADFDRDGLLDLIVANYVAVDERKTCSFTYGPDYCSPLDYQRRASRLYRNVSTPEATPEQVKFVDISKSSGIEFVAGQALGVVCADFTSDGWQDIFIANDGAPNYLWVNQRDLTFKEEATHRGIARNGAGLTQGNMGIALGDADRNGLLDVFVTHLPNEGHVLWIQDAPGLFRDATLQHGLGRTEWRSTGFGTAMSDFDNDADLDIAIVAGGVQSPSPVYKPSEETAKRLGPHWARYAERNQLFSNNDGRYTDISPANPAFCGEANVARGLIVADLDNDGGQDLVVCRTGAPTGIYRNTASDRGNWVQMRVVDPSAGGRDAIGAVVTVEAAGQKHVASLSPSTSYMVSNDPRLHYGLGRAATVDRVTVLWPDGRIQLFGPFEANRLIVLEKQAAE